MTGAATGLRGAAAWALEAILPPACLACQAPLLLAPSPRRHARDLLCGDCAALLQPLNQSRACGYCGSSPARRPALPAVGRCAECATLPAHFAAARGSFPYLGPAGAMVRYMKYRHAPWMAGWLVELALETPARSWLELVAGLPGMHVAPVPMHPRREWWRGYNQAREVAASLATALGLPMDDTALERPRAAPPQARCPGRAERLANLVGCFVAPKELLPGTRILLVDDVMTTGSTVAMAALALRNAGALEVYVFTPVRARLADDR